MINDQLLLNEIQKVRKALERIADALDRANLMKWAELPPKELAPSGAEAAEALGAEINVRVDAQVRRILAKEAEVRALPLVNPENEPTFKDLGKDWSCACGRWMTSTWATCPVCGRSKP